MKNKPSTLFINKFSTCLAKLKDTSTIQVGHQQFKQLLNGTQLKDIINPFVSKLDTVDRPTQRQKKQHAKLYIQLVNHFGEEILLQNYYQKFMESLVKKTICVADVIQFLCKGFLSRIHPLQNTKNYIIYILTLFRNHLQIHKIIKKIAQNISPIIVSSLQSDMISIIIEKMNLSRQKSQYIQSMMSIVLALQDKFNCQNLVQPILAKNLKNQDWNVRKACVDICYTFMVVKQQINSMLHQLIKQLKYDKIKNVRDSVLNYQSLYKQVYGEQESFKPQIYSQKTVRSSNQRNARSPLSKQFQRQRTQQDQGIGSIIKTGKTRNQTFFKNAKDSNVIRVSQDLSNNLSGINLNNRTHMFKEDMDYEDEDGNKLKQNRSLHLSSSPSLKTNKRGSKTNLLGQQSNTIKMDKKQTNLSPKFNINVDRLKQNQKFLQNQGHKNYLGDLNNKFNKKQPKILPYQIQDKKLNLSLESQQNQRRQYLPIKKSQLKNYGQKQQFMYTKQQKPQPKKIVTVNNTYFVPQSSSSNPSTPSLKQDINQQIFLNQQNISTDKPSTNYNFNSVAQSTDSLKGKIDLIQIKQMFDKFQQKIIGRLDKLQARVASLQNSQMKLSFGRQTTQPQSNQKNKLLQNLQDSAISLKNDHYFPYEDNNLFKKQNTKVDPQRQENQWLLFTQNQAHQALQSNLIQKVNEALKNHNVDEAFSLVLANNKVNLLLKLLQSLHIPSDKTVQECLLLQIKKQVSKKQVLKWLKNYLIERMQTIKSSVGGPIHKMLIKIRSQLLKQNNKSKQKDYQLLKTMVMNQMQEIFNGKQK